MCDSTWYVVLESREQRMKCRARCVLPLRSALLTAAAAAAAERREGSSDSEGAFGCCCGCCGESERSMRRTSSSVSPTRLWDSNRCHYFYFILSESLFRFLLILSVGLCHYGLNKKYMLIENREKVCKVKFFERITAVPKIIASNYGFLKQLYKTHCGI